MIEELTLEIRKLREEVKHLTLMIMKDKVDTTWLTEPIAAEMVGLSPRTLRRKVIERKPLFSDINYRHTNGRSFQYNRKDIFRFKELTSTAA